MQTVLSKEKRKLKARLKEIYIEEKVLLQEKAYSLVQTLYEHCIRGDIHSTDGWFQCVGVGEGCLYVYCNSAPEISIPYELEGVPIHVAVIGPPVLS